jgi:hypothetical protein
MNEFRDKERKLVSRSFVYISIFIYIILFDVELYQKL